MIDKLKLIFDSWKKYATGSPETEKMAKDRITLCFACDNLNKISHTCKLCGCFMPAKVHGKLARCPDDVWLEVRD